MSRQVSRTTFVPAPPEAVFDLLADPALHADLDGSGTVRRSAGTPGRLRLGSTFGMSMRLGVPYRVTNRVVEFHENRRIAWRHWGRHVWRWELEPADGGTRVRETFDWSTALSPRAVELLRLPQRNARAIEATLARLAQRFAAGS
ncbi:MAG: SRPBCC family protein [Euzebyaceae bacterium]|nr:SRPBCC family protein [Euzebyaceae bacterium]